MDILMDAVEEFNRVEWAEIIHCYLQAMQLSW